MKGSPSPKEPGPSRPGSFVLRPRIPSPFARSRRPAPPFVRIDCNLLRRPSTPVRCRARFVFTEEKAARPSPPKERGGPAPDMDDSTASAPYDACPCGRPPPFVGMRLPPARQLHRALLDPLPPDAREHALCRSAHPHDRSGLERSHRLASRRGRSRLRTPRHAARTRHSFDQRARSRARVRAHALDAVPRHFARRVRIHRSDDPHDDARPLLLGKRIPLARKEEEILYGDMESDILAQVVRCLEAAKSPES